MPYKDALDERARKSRREWYYRNKEKQKDYRKRRTEDIRLWYNQLKSSLKCSRCPEKHIAALCFHHKDPTKKEITVAKAMTNGWSKEKILKEIEKCEVLCANCHAKEHYRS